MKMRRILSIILALCLIPMFVGCATSGDRATPTPTAESIEITVAAAASLTDVTAELAEAYKDVAPNVMVTFTYGASGALQTQIEQGADIDLFLSAAQKQMNALEEQDLLLSGTRVDLLENKVVLITPTDSDKGITSFEDVATDKVEKVAIGDPESVPAGEYAKAVFTSLKIWDKASAKANLGTDVRQVLTWVESGDVDAGVVYATDAATTDKVKVITEAPAGSVDRIIYPAAVLKDSKNPDAAKAFLAFLQTDTAKAIFEDYGFVMA